MHRTFALLVLSAAMVGGPANAMDPTVCRAKVGSSLSSVSVNYTIVAIVRNFRVIPREMVWEPALAEQSKPGVARPSVTYGISWEGRLVGPQRLNWRWPGSGQRVVIDGAVIEPPPTSTRISFPTGKVMSAPDLWKDSRRLGEQAARELRRQPRTVTLEQLDADGQVLNRQMLNLDRAEQRDALFQAALIRGDTLKRAYIAAHAYRTERVQGDAPATPEGAIVGPQRCEWILELPTSRNPYPL